MIKLAEIFALKSEDEKKLHSYALKRFNDWKVALLDEVPQLYQLDIDAVNADINTYLSEEEKARVKKHKADITEWLSKCTNIGDGYSPCPYSTEVIYPMSELRQLVKTAYKRKEEKERWRAAYEAVNPPIDDAKRYLDKVGEYDEFIKATLLAIEVCMEKGQDYLSDNRTFDYRWALKKINDRKEKERQKIAANFAAREYNRRLNDEKIRLKAILCPNKKHLKSYFEKEIKDRRYTGENFSQFLSSEEEKVFDNALVSAASRKLDNLVCNDFRQFIDGKYLRSYFLLPSAKYSLDGTPCLDFIFEVFAVVEVRVSLKPGEKTFGSYSFNLPWREEKGYSVVLRESELLGYHYFVLVPEDLGGYKFWQTIPLVLILGLMSGNTEPAGTTILGVSESVTTYKIKNFKQEVTIPISFENYLKKIGNIDQMVNLGILNRRVANVIQGKLIKLVSEHRVPFLEEKMKRKDSKKAQAFKLFNEGKRPSDSEVKSLGIKPESSYRYYQQWKKDSYIR